MNFEDSFKLQIFDINEQNFEGKALEVFDFQYRTNNIYKLYCDYLGKSTDNVTSLKDIPFLPIEFFKTHEIKSGNWEHEAVFLSSGTTGQQRSKHFVKDLDFYDTLTQNIFERFFPKIEELQVLALLPSYQEQGHSSLIRMVDQFIKKGMPGSGYYLEKDQSLLEKVKSPEPKLLIGVSYALLNISDNNTINSQNIIVMETGGMKGRRKELTRYELHKILKNGFGVEKIYSEYGMTELMSQAYTKGDVLFDIPPWMKVLSREINDPFSYVTERTGGLNMIDLSNIYTCSFVEIKDLVKIRKKGFFEVLGRFDNSEIRGCNLLVQ